MVLYITYHYIILYYTLHMILNNKSRTYLYISSLFNKKNNKIMFNTKQIR